MKKSCMMGDKFTRYLANILIIKRVVHGTLGLFTYYIVEVHNIKKYVKIMNDLESQRSLMS